MPSTAAGVPTRRRLYVYSSGFLTQSRLRRILALAGWDIRLGRPGPGDHVGVWGNSPTAHRGLRMARAAGAPLLTVEDAFLRGLFPGRVGGGTIGLLLDRTGVHFDPSRPSDLETLLATHPLDDPALLTRARTAVAAMGRSHLSKFSATDPTLPQPDPGYVLVVDQTLGDAAVTASGGDVPAFHAMLARAQAEHPGRPILVKSHPESDLGARPGHFDAETLRGVTTLTGPYSPWRLLDGAHAVYTHSSGLGFEAILAGHRPVVFGTPFYAGWGLSDDRAPVPDRRTRILTRDQIFAAAMILYPTWYDPCRDRLCDLEDAILALDAQARAWREDRQGWRAEGMSRWKRPHLRAFFGQHGGVTFSGPSGTRRRMVWASAAQPSDDALRVEDGFLRSNGLGASLTPPLSLVLDDLGIYYDPARESRLERLIAESPGLPPAEIERARWLIDRICAEGLSKYNIGRGLPDFPRGRPRILVVGQVEDDASVVTGAGGTATNAALLARAADANPDAVLVYKPHPDVEAGLRKGRLDPPADVVLAPHADPDTLLGAVDAVWTMTSLLGFEALLRGKPVTVTGAPFYAGWGLTTDLGAVLPRRTARPGLPGLVHAALIGYPRYRDPVSGLPCPVEVVVDRLAAGEGPGPRGVLAWLQGLKGALRR